MDFSERILKYFWPLTYMDSMRIMEDYQLECASAQSHRN